MVWTRPTNTQCTIHLSKKAESGGESCFFWMFKVTVVNSYILYKISIQSPLSHLHYRRSIVDSLASRHLSITPPHLRPGRPSKRPLSSSGDPERFNSRLRHFPAKGATKQCAVCSNTKQGARTAFYCKGCPSHPNLCPDSCFEA